MAETPKCADCQRDLEKVRYQGGYLNEDQFDSIRAGDWFCEDCPAANGKRYRYFWNRDLQPVAAPAAPSVGEPEVNALADEALAEYDRGETRPLPRPSPPFPRKRLLAIARACTGKATEAEWAMVYKSAASKVWPSVIGEAIAAFRASRAEVAALRSSLEEARKDSERLATLRASIEALPRLDMSYNYADSEITEQPDGQFIDRALVLALFPPRAPSPRDEP